jgi:hypothetical protein
MFFSFIKGLCFEVDQCMDGERFADASDCEHYFECVNRQLTRQKCQIAFVFDIHNLTCIPASGSFDCDYRCLTSAPTTVSTTTSSGKYCKAITHAFLVLFANSMK